ncbi:MULTISPECIES: lysylphosphatidylglycerol synthase domain-containing protein [unclassified Streptomyces]|uniref:lysylphosphatidylglycerol synthase domain-containing protein n=1 Tax=Streptomyces sp. 135 TaxID=2838850 RepID=UPI001CBFC5BF|nr:MULTISPECIES: lysylphosphatidylglycerol synthase domain-containing protein [unclassified Streptomyces]WPO71563.1 lysylphosphatidylglycerol synthase domain-containing protein [Streptomyces sp. KN37]
MIRDQEETTEQQGVHPDDKAGSSASESHLDAGEPALNTENDGDSDDCAEGSGAHTDQLERDEPLLSARVHRPSDLMRLLVGILAIVVLLAIAAFAHGTTSGLEQDIDKGTDQAPDLLIKVAGLVASIGVLLVPVAFAIERLIKRDGLRIADGVLAAVLAHGVTLATDLWVAKGAPDSIQDALTKPSPADLHAFTDPVHGYLAPVIAYMTAVGMSRRPRWRLVLFVVLLLDAFTMLVTGYTTPFSILLTVLIGWAVAYGTLYAVGSPNVRPTGQTLLAGLRHVGFRPVSASREESPDSEHGDRGRRYFVTLEDGPPLDVTVIDREQQAQGFFYRVWRRLTLRGITQRRSLQSLRQALEQEALLAYAAIAAGANAPKLIATSELGPDAVMLVYEHTGGRSLDSLPDDAITDELLRDTWRQVRALQSRRIAHRRLAGDAVLVDRSGTVILTDLRGGEIAAGDLVLRMDIAQLLTALGLRVGAERAVACAVEILGPDAVADCLPLLQPIALTRSTRGTLRKLARERSQREREAVLEASRRSRQAVRAEVPEEPRTDKQAQKQEKQAAKQERQAEKQAIDEALEQAREEDLLTQIRHQVLLIRPTAPVEPAQLERIRPRTLISFIAGAIGAYFLLSQLTHVEFGTLFQEAEWGWVAAAVGFSALSYFAAAMSLLGFVPERVPFLRAVAAQVAGSFVKIVAPAAVGGVALNTRFLQRSGVRSGLAVASVGASQLFGLGSHILLLLVFGYLTGTEKTPSFTPSRTVIAGLLSVAVLVLVVTAIPFLRKFVVTRVRSLFAGVVPRMLDVLQRPQKLLTGIGGMLLLTLMFVLCLDASVRAFGNEEMATLSLASVAVVFLAGNALGSAAPTPGGVGAVEATLTFGLIAVGVPKDVAAPAVLLYRLLTLWLPVLPGWLFFNHLTRKGLL